MSFLQLMNSLMWMCQIGLAICIIFAFGQSCAFIYDLRCQMSRLLQTAADQLAYLTPWIAWGITNRFVSAVCASLGWLFGAQLEDGSPLPQLDDAGDQTAEKVPATGPTAVLMSICLYAVRLALRTRWH